MSTNGLGNIEVGRTNAGPFINLDFGTALYGYWATNFFLLATPDGLTPEYYVYNYMELGWTYQVDGGGANFVWPVRTGDVAHPTNGITVTVSPAGAGDVVGAGLYPVTFATTLTTSPTAGFSFRNWTSGGQVLSAANPYTFTATNDTEVVANFVVAASDPAIRIQSAGAAGLVLSWPATYTGYTLQESPTLDAAGWTAAMEPITAVGSDFQAAVTPSSGVRFYRLQHP